ncbi:MAG: carboxylating nicotinate-nucleotide diphosphorylase [Gammaproteobacteria bacterium]|nr:carboxylating nicotinate-nucleotide diphosphorylase [Gammaproteobacteria bacterium]
MDAMIQIPEQDVIAANVKAALTEDIGPGDLTAALVPATAVARGKVISRDDAIVCGRAWFDEVFRQVDDRVAIDWHIADGDRVEPNQALCDLQGPARSLLTGERAALNFLQMLSGTATTASRYAACVAGTSTRVLDTRKTIPGLRLAQKYAVRCGGADNHRTGLYDGILIKENHIRSAGSIAAAVAAAGDATVPVEVEIEHLDQLDEALDAGADIVMLDNFSLDAMRTAVRRNREHLNTAKLEASGNVSLETLADIAATGVDFVSVGALTKHVRAVDLSMQFSFGAV